MRRALRLLLFAAMAIAALSLTACFTTPEAGQIGVVRNGGPLDNHNIRQVVCPNSGNTSNGWGSSTHYYPANTQQRYYTISADASQGDRAGVDIVHVPTSDGVQVGIEGTFYLNTGFDCSSQGRATLEQFDNSFGTRTFPVTGTQDSLHPWDGDKGFAAFLDTVLRPLIDNDLRATVSRFRCEELQASCALVQSNGNISASQLHTNGQTNNRSIQAIQDAVNTGLQSDMRSALKGDYFSNVRFNLARVTLPDTVQGAINDAQAAFAQVTKGQAKVKQAKLEAQANEERQRGYQGCPACAQIDELKAIPPNVTTFAPGAGFSVTK